MHHGQASPGWGEAVRVTLPAGEDGAFTAGEKWLRSVFDAADVDDRVKVRGSGPVAFGTFTFDASSDGSVLIVPRTLLARDGRGRAWLTVVTQQGEAPGSDPGWPLPARPRLAAPADLQWQDGSLPRAALGAGGGRGGRRDQGGQPEQGGARPRCVRRHRAAPIDARILLQRLAGRYPDCFTFSCDGMIGATPELLVSRAGREVSALVLGGTLPRGADQAEDLALGEELLASAKNHEEHAYAVVSIREALEPLCATLDVDARPALLKFPNLQHLGTRVRGTLADRGTPKSALALAAAMHPPAAVCGTPTGTALELIRDLEHMNRERYAGPVGWVDAEGNGEWGIAIRCAQLSGRTARLFAGCGIVAGSEPAAELAETLVKLQPMRGALESRG